MQIYNKVIKNNFKVTNNSEIIERDIGQSLKFLTRKHYFKSSQEDLKMLISTNIQGLVKFHHHISAAAKSVTYLDGGFITIVNDLGH